MARNFDATALDPMMVGCAPTCPPGPKPSISPIVSVSSVNGESGDIVLKNLVIGGKEYNGSNEIHIYASDLGLGKAVVFVKTVATVAKVKELLADAETGDLFFCNEDGLFYLSVGEGDAKAFVSDMKLKDYSKIIDTASKIALEVDEDTLKMTAKLYDKNGQFVFESEPVLLPSGMKDAIKRGYYDPATNEIVFVLKNDTEVRVPMTGIIENLQPKITAANKLAFDLVEGLSEFKVRTEQDIATEKQARIEAVAQEAVLRENGDATEREERIAADQALQTAINTEVAARQQTDANLNTEIQQRKDSFDLLKVKIKEEAEERVKVEGRLNQEIADRIAGDTALQTSLSNETAERESADNTLTDAINAEKNTRVAQIIELRNSLANETNARTIRDAELADLIDDERAARESNDELISANLQQEVSDRTAAVDNEKTIRYNADKQLNARVDKEIEDRTKAISDEQQAREEADTALQTALDEEIARAIAEENKKVNILAEGVSGKAFIFNEIDGGGAKFESNDGTASFAGVNQDTATGIGAQLYDINVAENRGSKLDVTKNGIYYTHGDTSALTPILRDVEKNELAVKNDLADFSIIKDANPGEYAAVYHLTRKIGDGQVENVGEPINIKKDFLVKSASIKVVVYPDNPYPGAKPGDKYIDFVINSKEAVEPSKEEHIYLPVNDLVDIYTAGAGINISNNNVISINDETFTRLGNVETGLVSEKSLRIAGDSQLADSIELVGERLTTHTSDKANPHAVTKAQVGLGNADNTADINKPVSTAQQAAINSKADELRGEISTVRTALEASIANEATARANADTLLTNNLTTEAVNRQNADTTLQSNIDTEVTNRTTAIENEATARDAEDQNLWAAIRALENKITSVAKELICDGVSKEFTVAHNLDTYNVLVQIFENDAFRNQVVVDNARLTANSIKLTFKETPAENKSYIVMCYGIPMTYALAFDNNGGSGTMAGVNVVKGVPHIMEACTFVAPENKQFDKWAIGSPEGTKVAAGEAYTFNADTTAFATWKSSEPNFYYGSVASIPPTSIEGMTAQFVTRDELLTTPYEKTLPIAEFQEGYEAIAFSKALNVKILKVENFVFGAWQDVTEDFASTDTEKFTICYHKNLVIGPTEEQYRFTFVTK